MIKKAAWSICSFLECDPKRVTLQVLFRYSWLLTVMFYDKMILSKSFSMEFFMWMEDQISAWKCKQESLHSFSLLKIRLKVLTILQGKEVQLNSFVLCGEQFVVIVVQLLSNVLFFATPWTTACHSPVSSTISLSLLRFMSFESVMPSNHLILCCPLLLLPSVLPWIRVFSSELALYIRWPKYWSFSSNISPPSEYSG